MNASSRPGIAGLLARRRAAGRERGRQQRLLAYHEEGRRRMDQEQVIERGAPRAWVVISPIRLSKCDDSSGEAPTWLELPTGTSLRYEHPSGGFDYWNGETIVYMSRRFMALDGEFAGRRVSHSAFGTRDDDGQVRPDGQQFPPPELAPAEDDDTAMASLRRMWDWERGGPTTGHRIRRRRRRRTSARRST